MSESNPAIEIPLPIRFILRNIRCTEGSLKAARASPEICIPVKGEKCEHTRARASTVAIGKSGSRFIKVYIEKSSRVQLRQRLSVQTIATSSQLIWCADERQPRGWRSLKGGAPGKVEYQHSFSNSAVRVPVEASTLALAMGPKRNCTVSMRPDFFLFI